MTHTTIHQLEHWTKKLFEHYGWILLADEHGKEIKVLAYLESIDELIRHLELALEEYEDHDKLLDVEALLHKVEILREKAEEQFL